MPLTLMPEGKIAVINKCWAKGNTKKFLEGLGVLPGASILVISEVSGNLIVEIKGAKFALNREVAQQILVRPA